MQENGSSTVIEPFVIKNTFNCRVSNNNDYPTCLTLSEIDMYIYLRPCPLIERLFKTQNAFESAIFRLFVLLFNMKAYLP